MLWILEVDVNGINFGEYETFDTPNQLKSRLEKIEEKLGRRLNPNEYQVKTLA